MKDYNQKIFIFDENYKQIGILDYCLSYNYDNREEEYIEFRTVDVYAECFEIALYKYRRWLNERFSEDYLLSKEV